MAQIKTFGSGRISEAQRIADAERKKESAQIAETNRQANLEAGANAAVRKEAAKIVLEKEKNRIPPDVDILQKHAKAKKEQREADAAYLVELMEEHKKDKKMFYRFMKSAMTAALRDMGRSQETSRVAARLGVGNPISSGVMGVGNATGVLQDKVQFVEAICEKFAKKFRATGFIDQDHFESP